MSTPDRNFPAPVTVSPSLVTESEIPDTPANNVRTSLSQPPPPLRHRAVHPPQRPNPYLQSLSNLYAQTMLNQRPNSPYQFQQEPSAVLYPCAPLGRGFPFRPVQQRPLFFADPFVMAGNQNGHPPIQGLARNHRQFGPNQMETMMQFMRARNPQSPQFPRPGPAPPVRPVTMKRVPHFLQPRVSPPPASILDTSRNQNGRSQDAALVHVRGRKVRITEGASLYSLSRSWLRNDAYEGIQIQRTNTMNPLPKPLPKDMMIEASVPNDPGEELSDEAKEDEESVKHLSEKELLKRHIDRAKKVRARLKKERMRKIGRYSRRLALVLSQQNQEPMKK